MSLKYKSKGKNMQRESEAEAGRRDKDMETDSSHDIRSHDRFHKRQRNRLSDRQIDTSHKMGTTH